MAALITSARRFATSWIWVQEIKQDPKAERPEAGGAGDVSYVGDVPGTVFSILAAYKDLMQFYPEGRPDVTAPFFVSRDRTRPYTYGAARADLHRYLGAVVDDPSGYGAEYVLAALVWIG